MGAVYRDTAILARLHPAWSLTEIKNLTARERAYWMSMARYELDRRNTAR